MPAHPFVWAGRGATRLDALAPYRAAMRFHITSRVDIVRTGRHLLMACSLLQAQGIVDPRRFAELARRATNARVAAGRRGSVAACASSPS